MVHIGPDPDPTFNNGYINNFHLKQNINHNQQVQAENYGLYDRILCLPT